MAKATEQDLLDRGFLKAEYMDFYGNPKGKYYYWLKIEHSIIGIVNISVNLDDNHILLYLPSNAELNFPAKKLPPTTANLDLFIRFADGKEL